MDSPFLFAASILLIMAVMALVGVPVLKSLTLSIEGYREFKGDSMTRREKTRGWIGTVIWLIATIVIWSFYVDWFRAGNIEYAQDALAYRMEKIAENIGD